MKIGVAPVREWRSLRSFPPDGVHHLQVHDLEEALEMEHTTDAHCVCYSVRGEERWPRLAKEVLGTLGTMGAVVETRLLMLDYDNPNHTVWTRDLWDQFLTTLARAERRGFGRLRQAWAVYSTRAGARFVYVLKEPLTVLRAEALHEGLVAEFKGVGIAVDESCSDWTHLFRLPKVKRDGKNTSADPFFSLEITRAYLDASTVKPALYDASRQRHTPVDAPDSPAPQDPQAEALMFATSDKGKTVASAWVKQAKINLKGYECFSAIFEGHAIAEPGKRNRVLWGYVGQVVHATARIKGTTPEHVQGLMLPAVKKMSGDDGGKPWKETLWRAVSHSWGQEQARIAEERSRIQVRLNSKEKALDSIFSGLLTWSPVDLSKKDEDAVTWVERHAIAGTRDLHYFIMNQQGYYDRIPVRAQNLTARVRELGMESVVPFEILLPNGIRKKSVQEVIHAHTTAVYSIEGATHYGGNILRNPDSDIATLVLNLYKLRDIKPEYDAEVDSWLTALGGPKHGILKTWVGHSLNFIGPICALSISGSAGIGKKMFVRGLAENMETDCIADISEIVGQFQHRMAETPFMVCNEGFPRGDRPGQRDPADSFRSIVGGDAWQVEHKGMQRWTIFNPMRVVITANNIEVLTSLHAHRNLSPEDRDALALRLLPISCTDDAARYLRNLGGRAYTGKPGRRWIRGDDGAPSDLVVAKHFRWLYHNRPDPTPNSRLLVEGDMDSTIVRRLATQSGAAPVVIEALTLLLEEPTWPEGLIWQDNRLLITSSTLLTYMRRNHLNMRVELTTNHVSNALAGVSNKGLADFSKLGNKYDVRRRWWDIDIDLLREQSLLSGWRCLKIDELCRQLESSRASTP